MAFNSGFPVAYQPMFQSYQQPMQQPQQIPQAAPQIQNNPMIWVQGETGAKSYLLTPNTTLPLWDSESQTIYLKSSDASGMPSMKILDYTIREQNPNQQNTIAQPQNDFVTHKELSDFREEITGRIESIGAALKRRKEEDESV